jgi:hypothetical protein
VIEAAAAEGSSRAFMLCEWVWHTIERNRFHCNVEDPEAEEINRIKKTSPVLFAGEQTTKQNNSAR